MAGREMPRARRPSLGPRSVPPPPSSNEQVKWHCSPCGFCGCLAPGTSLSKRVSQRSWPTQDARGCSPRVAAWNSSVSAFGLPRLDIGRESRNRDAGRHRIRAVLPREPRPDRSSVRLGDPGPVRGRGGGCRSLRSDVVEVGGDPERGSRGRVRLQNRHAPVRPRGTAPAPGRSHPHRIGGHARTGLGPTRRAAGPEQPAAPAATGGRAEGLGRVRDCRGRPAPGNAAEHGPGAPGSGPAAPPAGSDLGGGKA